MSELSGMPVRTGIEAQVVAEHRRILHLAGQLGTTSDLRDLLIRLDELRRALVVHFRGEEEPGGLYDMIRATVPDRIAWVAQLEKEHQAFLAGIDALAARTRTCLAGPVAELLAQANALAVRLRAHEAAEDDVLIDSLYNDPGQGDG